MIMDLQDSIETVAIRSHMGKFSLVQQMGRDIANLGMEMFPLRIVMPCGCEVEYDYNTFPERTTACSCGNPEHKVVEYILH